MSKGSFRRIDYSIRPAKHAERRMLCEIFRKLRPFQPVEDYLYVGLGSVWFSDFILFHRALAIKRMISIEKSGSHDRFLANKPFGAIEMAFGQTSVVLPKLDWTGCQFMWLDYDDPLSPSMLLDAQTVATRATSGTIYACSFQCHQAQEISQAEKDLEGPKALEIFINNFGRERIPTGISEDDLYAWPFSQLTRQILSSEVENILATRNSGLPPGDKISFIPICSINYEDGAKMTTLVGAFVRGEELEKFHECKFEDLDFLPPEGKHISINIPKLTIKEIKHLEQQLPRNLENINLGSIPNLDAKNFSELYRYLPNFAVLEN